MNTNNIKTFFRNNWKCLLLKFILVVGFVAVDLVTKILFFGINEITIIPFILGFRNAGGLNTGGAWGVLGEYTWILILITICFFALIIFFDFYLKSKHLLYIFSFSLIFSGAFGNFIDRIFLGGVRDFIFFEFMPSFPTFNFADSCLTIGMVLLIIYLFFVKEGREEKLNKEEDIKANNVAKLNVDITSSDKKQEGIDKSKKNDNNEITLEKQKTDNKEKNKNKQKNQSSDGSKNAK